jgi:hypothetical protein
MPEFHVSVGWYSGRRVPRRCRPCPPGPRVDQPFGPLSGAAGVGQADFPPPDHGGLQQVDRLGPAAITLAPPCGVDHRGAGGLGVGPEGLRQRSHEFAQRRFGLTRDGRRRADEQKQRLRLGCRQAAEVGAGATDQRPAAAASGLRVDGMPAADSASRSRRAVATDTSSSPARSAAVTRPRACMSSRAATRRSARMSPASLTKCSVDEHFRPEDGHCH